MLKKLGKTTKVKQKNNGPDVPPGQHVTDKFPVLSFGPTPDIDLATWRFTIFGLVDQEVVLDWQQFNDLPKVVIDAAFHCVTQWSRLENTWEGVAFSELMRLASPKSEAKYVMAHCYGDHTTNIALDVLLDGDVLFASRHDGHPLEPGHGGPLRLIVPKRYAWKSAKWINGIEFMAEDSPGFYELRGYHMQGDPWKEQRFQDG